MRIDIVTGFPDIFQGPLTESVISRACASGKAEIVIHWLRDYAHDKHRTIDDTPYGGGAGMILKAQPIFECCDRLLAERMYDDVILTTPQGERYTQETANRFSLAENLLIICGHYKGVDQRVCDALVTKEISIGDYVTTGGEVAAIVLVDTIVRLIPGSIGDGESLLNDSFMEDRLDCAYYTKPAEYRGLAVPEELLSGNHEKIETWRRNDALQKTSARRPDLLARQSERSSAL